MDMEDIVRVELIRVDVGDPENDQREAAIRGEILANIAHVRDVLDQCDGDRVTASVAMATFYQTEPEFFTLERLTNLLAVAMVELAIREDDE
jgi:hypothetical protein